MLENPENPPRKRQPAIPASKSDRQPVRKLEQTVSDYVEGIRAGNRIVLGQAITLVESLRAAHQNKARQIVEACLPFSGQSFRVGITGTPGVGKSSFIEALGLYLCEKGEKLAVLAIDPSSQRSKGSILGDKTRMQALSNHANAFIRPSPAGTSLGGVARRTREIMILCEAAGYDHVFVETVGVGQSETAVHAMVDCFLLLLLPGAGDELQGIKRGIVEMADLIAINKADGDRMAIAKESQKAYRNALHLFPPAESGWIPKVMTCSALQRTGIDTIWAKCQAYHQLAVENGYFEQHRRTQARYWFYELLHSGIRLFLQQNSKMKKTLEAMETAVMNREKTAFHAAGAVLEMLGSTDWEA